TVDFIDFPYRHVAVSPHQQSLRLAENLANGGAVDYYLIGRLDNHEDRSGYDAVKDLFHYHAANEGTYVDMTSKAEVMLLKAGVNHNEYRGWFRFLVENHVFFDVVREDAALDVSWDRYTMVIVPAIDVMTDALAERLDAFAEYGGTLLVTGQSGFRDENFNLREMPALQSLGIEDVLLVADDMRSAYLKFEDKAGFARFDDTDLVYVDGPYVYAHYDEETEEHMQLIPPHNFGPPERCYYDLVVDHPGFVVHPFGAGRAIYVPWMPGALFHRQGHINTAWFCADLLEGIAGVAMAGGNLSPMVEATLAEKNDGSYMLLSLVNASGHFGNSFYAPVTMTDVAVEVPLSEQPVSVAGLRSGHALPHEWVDGTLTVHVPSLALFEAIKIMLPESTAIKSAGAQGAA
ncbi:MAG: beta-galactosidase trimerization domain-containing protein, partial [Anaerolineae bacterium]|nr:beta-galactosidase trimerization domain-containing protein [Anaerolineae bacterium]